MRGYSHHAYQRFLLALILLPFVVGATRAQTLDLARMPVTEINNPALDLHGIERPALSVTGFDNAAPGRNAAHGLGLKQILQARDADEALVAPVFDRVVELAHSEQASPYAYADLVDRRRQLDRNTAILQSRAFEALATFVLEINGFEGLWGLRTHEQAAAALVDAFVQPPGGVLIHGDVVDDLVKYSRSIANVARALDLYLALENAYAQFPNAYAQLPGGSRAPGLLSPQERAAVFGEYGAVLLGIDAILETRAIDVYADDIELSPELEDLLLRLLERLPTGDRLVEEAEPGNWAMKQRLALGYGSMAMQVLPGSPEADRLAALLAKARRSATVVGDHDENRRRHWNFMTYGGKRFWAEGPYYLDFSLEQVLPFWHALRAAGTLHADEDPFQRSWFTAPLAWHADLVTPDGRIAPLDDGNKAPVRYTGLLRWDDAYGDASLGRRYAWIENRLDGPARRDETLLVELAIPRTAAETLPPHRVGSTEKRLVPHKTEQQLVRRMTPPTGATHYVLLNGEHGKSVDRGEGHEQPDQLQLLYYRDDTSYLLDSGYDQGATVENSSWNHYYDHNVMVAGTGEGGLYPPQLSLLEVRKSSEPWFMGEVDALYTEEHGAVTVMHGQQKLNVVSAASEDEFSSGEQPTLENLIRRIKSFRRATYTRDVIVIGGREPYLVDLNSIRHWIPLRTCEPNRFRMLYHGHSDDAAILDDGRVRWSRIGDQDDQTLDAFPMSVEFPLTSEHRSLEPDEAMEREGTTRDESGPSGKDLVDIAKLRLSTADACRTHWTVATVLQTDPSAGGGPAPSLIWRYGWRSNRQGWVWDRSDGTFDVFVARSISAPRSRVRFNPSTVDRSFPDIPLRLPRGVAYGFARLERSGGKWHIDPDYRLHLEGRGTSAKTLDAADGQEDQQRPHILSEAYPNPFNPTTHFTLRIQESQSVQLAVYDMLGRRVALLHDGPLSADRAHHFEVDGSRWSSGLYLVRADGEHFAATRRLTLAK